MKKPKAVRRVLYVFFVIARIGLPLLPLSVIRCLGSWLGLMGYACARNQRELALQHLTLAFGDARSPAERRRIARRMFQYLGMNVLEWLAMPKFDALRGRRLVQIDGMEHVQAALARGQGVLFVSGHFGNWELLAAYFGWLGMRGGVLARHLRYPEYESWLIAMRRAHGVETFYRDTSFKELVRCLTGNECIGIMPDQDVDSVDGVFVEFFGRPTYTPTGPAVLARLTGATLLPAYIVREGRQFRVHVEAAIPVPHTADRARDVQDVTQAWSRVTERYIRQYPDQWVWMHRRWKTQPVVTERVVAGRSR